MGAKTVLPPLAKGADVISTRLSLVHCLTQRFPLAHWFAKQIFIGSPFSQPIPSCRVNHEAMCTTTESRNTPCSTIQTTRYMLTCDVNSTRRRRQTNLRVSSSKEARSVRPGQERRMDRNRTDLREISKQAARTCLTIIRFRGGLYQNIPFYTDRFYETHKRFGV